VKPLSSDPFLGRLLALPTYIRLDWKGLQLTNAVAHYEKSLHAAVKSLVTLTTGANVITHFTSVIYVFS
jgi:hypothetical protein